jgi:allantoicase
VNTTNKRAVSRWAVVAALAACAIASAAELSSAAQKEITQLLERIETSNCSFSRNGTWYPGAEARKHLQMKLDYMVKRNMLGSTEEFISKAATASSVSGEAYQIRCGTQAPVASAAWLNAELKRIRSSS